MLKLHTWHCCTSSRCSPCTRSPRRRQRAAGGSRGSERAHADRGVRGGEAAARPQSRGVGGEPTRMLARVPGGQCPGRGCPLRRGAAHGEPGRRGPRAEKGALRSARGASPLPPPRGCESHWQQVGAPAQSFQRRGSRRTRDLGHPISPASLEPQRRQVPPVRPPPGPAGNVPVPTGSRRTLRPPARLAASAGWPPRAPLLLPSARAGRAARMLPAPHRPLLRWGLGAEGGASAGSWVPAGGRLEPRALRVRTVPSVAERLGGGEFPAALTPAAPPQTLLRGRLLSLHPPPSRPRFSVCQPVWGPGCRVMHWYSLDVRELKARKQLQEGEACSS